MSEPNFRAKECYAFVCIDPVDNSEGLLGKKIDMQWNPFISFDLERMKCLIPEAQRIATQIGREVKIVCFRERVDLETIHPHA